MGFSEDRVLRSGLASEALRVVLRGFVVLPLLTQGQLYAFYLFFTTGGGGSVSLITRQGRVRRGRPLLSRPRGAVDSGLAAVLAAVESVAVFVRVFVSLGLGGWL